MEQNDNKKSSILYAVIIIMIAFFLMIMLFLLSKRDDTAPITLPDSSPEQSTQPNGPSTQQDNFVHVTTENVLSVVETLHRPTSYHQTYTVTLAAGEQNMIRTVDIWVDGGILRADVISESEVASILTDHQTAYLWYSDDETPAKIALNPTIVTPDDLLGIPTYELLLNCDPETLSDALYLVLQDPVIQCIYVAAQSKDDAVEEYWVDIDTGLLYRSTVTEKKRIVYSAQQETLELLAAEDEIFSDYFLLPDGTEPFSGK